MSENLYEVRDDTYLLQDVIVGQMTCSPSRWYTDSNIRLGVRAVLKMTRCAEEECRLPVEAKNMKEWFFRELTAVQLAILGNTGTFLFNDPFGH
jgi:hypothetical protein